MQKQYYYVDGRENEINPDYPFHNTWDTDAGRISIPIKENDHFYSQTLPSHEPGIVRNWYRIVFYDSFTQTAIVHAKNVADALIVATKRILLTKADRTRKSPVNVLATEHMLDDPSRFEETDKYVHYFQASDKWFIRRPIVVEKIVSTTGL